MVEESVAAVFREQLASVGADGASDGDEWVTYGARFERGSPEVALLESVKETFGLTKSDTLRLVVRLSIGHVDQVTAVGAVGGEIEAVREQVGALGAELETFGGRLDGIDERLERLERAAGAGAGHFQADEGGEPGVGDTSPSDGGGTDANRGANAGAGAETGRGTGVGPEAGVDGGERGSGGGGGGGRGPPDPEAVVEEEEGDGGGDVSEEGDGATDEEPLF